MSAYPNQPPPPQSPDIGPPSTYQPYQGQQPPYPPQPPPPKQGASGMAIGALAVGIMALFTSPYIFIGVPVGLVAVGLGLAGRSGSGRKMALTGFWLGVAAILVSLATLIPEEDTELAADDVADDAPTGQLAEADQTDAEATSLDQDEEAAQSAASEAAAAQQAAEERESEFSTSIVALAVGDCFNSVTVGETVFSLTEVSCASEHEGEVAGAFTVEGMTEEEELVAEADQQCPPLVLDYLGDEAQTFDGQIGYLFQTSGDGPRAVRCYIIGGEG